MERNSIFISYSHQDKEWLDRINIFLKPLVRSNEIVIWDDTKIQPGQFWQDEIKHALASSKVAILLVSPYFLASDFINDEELPTIFKAASGQGMTIFWVAISHSLYQETELGKYQAANNPKFPLDSLEPYERDAVIVKVCQRIKDAIKGSPPTEKRQDNAEGAVPKERPEIAPDDWSSNPGKGLFGKLKKLI